MSEKQPYSYTVLRYVHDVISGEFINVGVVVYVPSRNALRCKTRSSVARLKGAFPDLNRPAFTSAMRSVKKSLAKIAKEIEECGLLKSEGNALTFARKALATDDSSLQWSPAGSGVGADASIILDRLYNRMVAKYDVHSNHGRSDDDIWRPVRDRLNELHLPISLEEKLVSGASDEISLKHAWKNGKWHAYEPVSLDLVDAENIKDKARRWLGHLNAVSDAREDLVLRFIVGKPQSPALQSAYKSAIEILRKAPFGPVVYEESEVDALVAEIAQEAATHNSN